MPNARKFAKMLQISACKARQLIKHPMTKSWAWMFTGQATTQLISTVTALLIISALPKQEYGIYRFVLSVLPFIALLTHPGVNTRVLADTASGNNTLKEATAKRLKTSVLATAAAMFISLYYFLDGSMELSAAFAISGTLFPLSESISTTTHLLYGRFKFIAAVFLEMSVQLSRLIIIATALYFISKQSVVVLTASLLSVLLLRVIWYNILQKQQKTASYLNRPEQISDSFREFDKGITTNHILSTINANIDKLFIWFFMGALPLAKYSAAFLIATFASRFLSLIPQVFLPYNIRNGNKGEEHLKIALLIFLVVFLLVLLALPLLGLIYKYMLQKYFSPETVLSAQILLLSQVFFLFSNLIWNKLLAQKNKLAIYLLPFIQSATLTLGLCILWLFHIQSVTRVALVILSSSLVSATTSLLILKSQSEARIL